MARRRSRYDELPEQERKLAESGGMGKPNSYVPGPDDPAYYSPEVLDFLRDREAMVLGGPDASIEGLPSNGRSNGNGAKPKDHQGRGQASSR